MESTDPLAVSTSLEESSTTTTSMVDTTPTSQISIVHVAIPQTPTIQVQSVIQANQQSVIQSAANSLPLHLGKGNVILVKPSNSVIHTTGGNIQVVGSLEAGSDESMSNDEDGVKHRRDILARRPSYRKILNELGVCGIGGVISEEKGCSPTTSESSQENEHVTNTLAEGTYQTTTGLLKVIPAGSIRMVGTSAQDVLHDTLTITNATAGGAIVQYAQSQDGQYFLPAGMVVTSNSGSPSIQSHGDGEGITQKREMRLLKNREAARECRRKKKEYIKCLENRVAVLENQNKALIEELKTLKELYCQQNTITAD